MVTIDEGKALVIGGKNVYYQNSIYLLEYSDGKLDISTFYLSLSKARDFFVAIPLPYEVNCDD